MNPSTQPQQMQAQPTGQMLNTQPSPQMPPDQAAASLAFATNLSDQLMQHKQSKQTQDTSKSSETAPGKENPQDKGKGPSKDKSDKSPDTGKELDALRTEFDKKLQEMKKGITDEIKADIEKALSEEDTSVSKDTNVSADTSVSKDTSNTNEPKTQ